MSRDDRHACESLIRAYRPMLFRVARAMGSPRAEAEDLAQEVSLAAWQALQRDADVRDWRRWLLVVLRRRFTDRLRRAYRSPETAWPEVTPADETPGPLEQAADAERRRLLQAELASPDHRCLRLQLAGLTYLEIAALVKRDVTYVRHRLVQSRAAIRARLTESARSES